MARLRVTFAVAALAAFALPASARADAVDEARAYVRAKLPAVDFGTLAAPEAVTAGDVTSVRWRQTVDGIPAADNELRVNVARGGRVLGVVDRPLARPSAETTPALSAGEAVGRLQAAVNSRRSLVASSGPAGATRATRFADGTTAKLRLLDGRLTWRVFYRASSTEIYDAFVDADSGKVVKRANMVKSADIAVWDNYPGSPDGGTATAFTVPAGWLSAAQDDLLGPYVRAYSDLDADDAPDDLKIAPALYTFNTFGGLTCAVVTPCSWGGSASPLTVEQNRRQNATQAFYFANRFREHLAAPPINFDGFQNNDRVLVETDDGGGLNNANMFTPPDGESPVMQMYLWDGLPFRTMNGGDDASIVYHEYTHGLSSRLVVDADGVGALNSPQAGALGEGWSDWYAKDFLVTQFPGLDKAAQGDVHMGTYTDFSPNAIRHRGLDCPVNGVACKGFTYADFGKIFGEPEVHADGEIWAQTLWDLRTQLPGDALRLITDGMKVTPPEPSFLDARDAIIDAAGPALADQVWAVFAARGMGYYASTTGSDDRKPVADFTVAPGPGERSGTLSGRVTDVETGAAIAGATVALGPERATSGADGRYTLSGLPQRTYSALIVRAPGYDRLVTSATVTANATADVPLRRNWAAGPGAIATGTDEALGCGTEQAIDQNPGTVWSALAAKTMLITLPTAVTVHHFEIDPGEGCGDTRAAAARVVRIQYATAVGGPMRDAAQVAFGDEDRHRANLVYPTAPLAGVRQVQVSMLSNQGFAPWTDLSEFGIYSTGPPGPTPTVTPVPTAIPTPFPTVAPPRPPVATPVPPITAKPSFALFPSGKRAIRVRVVCPSKCAVRATLTVDAATARKLKLGKSRTAGTLARTVKAGTTTLTVKLSRRVKFGKLRSFRATFKVRSGTVTVSRRVKILR